MEALALPVKRPYGLRESAALGHLLLSGDPLDDCFEATHALLPQPIPLRWGPGVSINDVRTLIGVESERAILMLVEAGLPLPHEPWD